MTPRRLMNMTKPTSSTPSATRQGKRPGKADVTCATPEEIETDTVRM